MTEQCSRCRFWKPVSDEGDCPVDGPPFGWCRRNPPAVVERMAGMLIPSLGNSKDNYDPEDVATVSRVADCSLYPATFYNRWCGRFEEVLASDPHLALLAERNTLIDYLDSDAPTEAEGDEGAGRLNALDNRILGTAATTQDGVFAKLLLSVQLITEGAIISDEHAPATVREARAVTDAGRVSPNVMPAAEVAP